MLKLHTYTDSKNWSKQWFTWSTIRLELSMQTADLNFGTIRIQNFSMLRWSKLKQHSLYFQYETSSSKACRSEITLRTILCKAMKVSRELLTSKGTTNASNICIHYTYTFLKVYSLNHITIHGCIYVRWYCISSICCIYIYICIM